MDIHPAVAFGSVIAGGGILGGVGTLLALPAAAIIQAFVSSFVHRHDIIDSDLAEVALSGAMPVEDGDVDDPESKWINRVSERLERQRGLEGQSGTQPGGQGVDEDP